MRIVVLLVCSVALGAQAGVYKWTDTRGRVHYGDAPPASAQAAGLALQPPAGVQPPACDPRGCAVRDRPHEGTAQRAGDATAGAARGMPFGTYIRLKRGMREGELLLRAGAPDFESADTVARAPRVVRRRAPIDPVTGTRAQRVFVQDAVSQVVKTYYYFPTRSDPWTTVITLAGGRIVHMDRQKSFR